METVVVRKSDNEIVGGYPSAPNISKFVGVNSWGDSGLFMHLQVPDGADPRELIYDGTDLIEDATKIQAAYDADLVVLKQKRSELMVLCDWTQLPDALSKGRVTSQEVSDWADYRQALADLPASLDDSSSLDVNLVSTSGQDDINVTSDDPESNEYTLTVLDPASAPDQALLITTSQRKHVTVNLATDSEGVITSTIQEVVDAINAHKVASKMVDASVKAGATGTDIVDTFLAQTNLAGGATIKDAVWPTPPATPIIPGIND